MKSYFQEIGYDASFGVKQIRGEELTIGKDNPILETEEVTTENEEKLEIGEQFSLEDFGIS